MSEYIVTDLELQETADSIRAKTGSVVDITWKKNKGFADDIDAIPSGGGGGFTIRTTTDSHGGLIKEILGTPTTIESLTVTQNGTINAPAGKAFDPVIVNVGGGVVNPVADGKDVNFIDYDGTIRYSYTAAEFAALNELPANPTHTGLTAQGWNWSLSNAKTHVAKYGVLTIGQMYITADGKTHIDIVLDNPDLLSPYLKIAVQGAVTIDWGDNSALETVTGAALTSITYRQHIYTKTGAYTIKIASLNGQFTFYQNYILSHSTTTSAASRRYNSSITEVRLGSGITNIYNYAFSECYGLRTVTIPNSVTFIADYAFNACSCLSAVIIPNSITRIYTYVFQNNNSLRIVSLPQEITAIDNYAFQNDSGIQTLILPDGVSRIGDYAFGNMRALRKLLIPDSVTNIGTGAFNYSRSLQTVILPNITSLPGQLLAYGDSLQALTIPNNVTSIAGGLVNSCPALAEIRFEPTAPPTVSNSNAFASLPTDCKIYVPTGSLSAYTSATNYPSSSTYTYIEY